MRFLHVADVHLDTPFASRSPEVRARLRDATREAFRAAVDLALEWLNNHQSPGGHWDSDGFEDNCKLNKCGGPGESVYDPGQSGLALLCFLGAGETHNSGQYKDTVKNGLRYYVPTRYNGTWIPADYWDNTPGIGIKWGDSPLGGAHIFLPGGLHLLAQRTSNATLQQKALFYGNKILGQLNDHKRWSKWNFTIEESLVN